MPQSVICTRHGSCTVLGIGRITGGYRFATEPVHAPHQRGRKEPINTEPWELPLAEGQASAFRVVKDHANQVEAERRLLSPTPPRPPAEPKLPPVTGQTAQIEAILERKGQVILYGPPGTGKTYVALNAVREFAARSADQKPFAALAATERAAVGSTVHRIYALVTFHPGYSYEDFIEGYRPLTIGESMGTFPCATASSSDSAKMQPPSPARNTSCD